MEGRWFEDPDTALSEINITPLVDVAMVLLIIFMITAPLMVQGADVRLPETRPMDRLPSGAIYITVTADERVLLNEITVSIDELEQRLIPLVDLGESVYIRGDQDVPYGTVLQVLDRIRGAGLINVNLLTTPIPERDQ